MQPFNEAVSIMLVGMITVFFILFTIVFIGNVIIRLSNKYLPDVVKEVKSNNPNNTIAAIEAAIVLATKGKGRATEIKKV